MPDHSGPELCAMTAYEAVQELKPGDLNPSELLDAALERVEPAINAMPTLCAERARASLEQLPQRAARTEIEEACPELPELYETYITLRGMCWAAVPSRLPENVQSNYKRTLAENIELGRNLSDDQIYDAQRKHSVIFANMHKFLENYDVLACPVVGLEPGPVEEEYPPRVNGRPIKDYVDWLRFSFLSTTTGIPAISVPAGYTASGMPMGIQLIGPPRGDAKLLSVAAYVEEMVGLAVKLPIDPVVATSV